MKTHLLSIFVAIVAFAAAQQTSAQTLGTANNDQPVSPKPSFKIEYSVPLTIKSNNKTLDKDNIQNGDYYLYNRKYDLHDEATLTLKSNPTVAIMLAGVEIDVDEEMSLVEGEYIADEPQKKVEEYKEGDVAGEVVEITDNSSTQVWAVDPENDTKRTRTVTYTRTTTVTEINEQMTETTVTVTVEAKDVIQNVTHHNTTLTFITHDLYSLEPGETYTLTMPLFNDQVTADQFDYTVMDCEVVSVDTEFNTDEVINEPLIVKEGAELEISGNVTVNNKLIVLGPTSGIRIHEGGSLTVADTAYFIGPKDWQSLDFPWLINKGTFDNGDRTIFTRSVEHGNIHTYNQPYPVSMLIKKTKIVDLFTFYERDTYMSIATHANPELLLWPDYYPDEEIVYNSIENKGLIFATDATYAPNHKNQIAAVRFVGELVDESTHTEDASAFIAKGSDKVRSYATKTSIDNVYQAPIDIRGVVESEKAENFTNMEVAKSRHNKYTTYNVYSGITTYDGPMQYGYLLPHMTHLRAPSDVDTRMEYGKDDLTTYEEIVDKYPVATTYPYIRFFVEDIKEESVYFGNRDVCAVYFIPKEEYEDRELDPFYSIDYKYETITFVPYARGAYTIFDGLMQYPFIYASLPEEGTVEQKHSFGLKIKVLPLPETDEDFAEFSLVYRTKSNSDRVGFGVLDSNLPNIDVFLVNGNVETKITSAYNNPFTMPDASKSEFLNLNTSHYYTIDFKVKKHKETGSQSGVSSSFVEDDLIVYASDGCIILEGAEIGSLIELHDLSGAVVARQNVDSESESLQVSENGVYFVSVCTSNAKYNRKVMVK